MILYLDTSALVKLFVEEAQSKRIRRTVSGARLITTHVIAYAEACATFARIATKFGHVVINGKRAARPSR